MLALPAIPLALIAKIADPLPYVLSEFAKVI
jgi:hypothetical protein